MFRECFSMQKNGKAITPSAEFMISGNKISVRALDLILHFSQIAFQLNEIAERYL